MKCERCGSTELAEHPYDRTFVANTHSYELCETCQGDLNDIIAHVAQGGRINLVGDNKQGEWGYWIDGNQRMTSVPT